MTRTETGTSGPDTDRPVLLFDGVCNLCNGFVQFVLRHERRDVLQFGSLQSEEARELLEACGLPPEYTDSLVVVEGSDYYTKSSAVLRVAHHLGGAYRLLGVLRVVPRTLNDFLYDVVAANRYDWFGRREACMVPSTDVESRFIDGGGTPRRSE